MLSDASDWSLDGPQQRRGPATGIAVAEALATMRALGDCTTAEAIRCWLGIFAQRLELGECRYVHLGHAFGGAVARESDPPARFLSSRPEDERGRIALGMVGQQRVIDRIRTAFIPFKWPASAGVGAMLVIPVQDYCAGPAYLALIDVADAIAARLLADHGPDLVHLATRLHSVAKQVTPLSDRGHAGSALTTREIECLRLAALGRTVADSGRTLGIKGRTVEFHLKNASAKLGAASKLRAVALAVSDGLITI